MAMLRCEAETVGFDASGELEDAIIEAKNELEMHLFLLSESDIQEAETLLELEAEQQPLPVARKLNAQREELAVRGMRARSRSPDMRFM